MKILIHGINFAPELTGIGKYTGEMAAWLAEQGNDVRAVTAPPYYPQWEVAQGYSGRTYTKETSGSLTVHRCPLWVPKVVSGKARILHLASFAASSLPVVLSQAAWKPDLVFTVEPTFFTAPQALLAARLCGAKAWLHVQDLEVDASLQLGIIPQGMLMDGVLATERWFMNRFDVVSSISAKMLERLAAKGVDESKLVRFDNWVDTSAIRPLGGTNTPFRQELDLPRDAVLALYSGNMGEKQGLDIVIEAAKRLRNEPIVFVLCGAGAARQRLEEAAKGLEKVRFLPLQPFEQLNELLNSADIHLLPQRPDVEDLVMPSKLTGILSAGGPLVATAQEGSELARAVKAAGGLVTLPGDAAAFAEAIQGLAVDAERRGSMRVWARDYALEHMAKEAILSRFLGQATAPSR